MTKLTKEYIYMLSEKWLNGTISEKEKHDYDLWYRSFKDNEIHDLDEEELLQLRNKIYRKIRDNGSFGKNILKNEKKSFRSDIDTFFWIVAALFSVFILIGYLLYSGKYSDTDVQQTTVITPGRNQATLTIENGLVVNLDSMETGDILLEKGIRVEKTEQDELVYTLIDSEDRSEIDVFTSTITTPRGGQYKLLLPDGSVVWLNAASSLIFPSRFADDSRVVELTGEAYFDVAKDPVKPFEIRTNKAVITVLGTSFNVNSYEDESVLRTTLVEGKIELHTGDLSKSKILIPGEEAIVSPEEEIRVHKVNIQDVVAWKNGDFMFNNENIRSVMRKISRWYDVEVFYEEDIKDVPIWGSVSRYDDIAEVLKIIELTEAARFKIAGRRVYVMK